MQALRTRITNASLLFVHRVVQDYLPHWSKWPGKIAGLDLGLLPLLLHRMILQRMNLSAAAKAPRESLDTTRPVGVNYRPDDGYGVDAASPRAGMVNGVFGRNMPPRVSPPARDSLPDVQHVAQRLLARKTFVPAGDQLNVLAAAWIQAMVHDWVGHHARLEDDVVLAKGAVSGCPMSTFRFHPTREMIDTPGAFANSRTHWWDASFVYGQTPEAVTRARTFHHGLLHTTGQTDGGSLPGDRQNSWIGVSLLQDLFIREHNAIATSIAQHHPELAGNDEKLFNRARLVVAALVAKIHTVEWTPTLLKTPMLETAMKVSWFGLPLWPSLFRLIKGTTETHGVPFCLTEEFTAVYRLHAMLPDGLQVDAEYIPLENLLGAEGDRCLDVSGATMRFWKTIVREPCGALVPHNYPLWTRSVHPTTPDGEVLPSVDLAALDLYRDRERGIPMYNAFRRHLHLRPCLD